MPRYAVEVDDDYMQSVDASDLESAKQLAREVHQESGARVTRLYDSDLSGAELLFTVDSRPYQWRSKSHHRRDPGGWMQVRSTMEAAGRRWLPSLDEIEGRMI